MPTRPPPKARKPDPAPDAATPEWRDLLCLLPGYDPFAQAAGCWFDVKEAEHALAFFPECLRHIEGAVAGQPFRLERWQQSVIANLFGWKRRNAAGRAVRRYKEVFLEVPRKNGKTPLCAGIALYVLFCDSEFGQQNYIAAGDRKQAGKMFRHCKGMIEQEPEMANRCRPYGGKGESGQSRSIVCDATNSFLLVISADAGGEHGGNSHLVIIDELHVQPNDDLVRVLTTSFASENREQTLFINVTTAGFDRHSICYKKYTEACRIRDNAGDPAAIGWDPAFLPVIYETKPEDDWTLEATWQKANPNLGVSVSLAYLQRECGKAQETPDYENTFRQLHLNQWTEQASRWLSMAAWDRCGPAPPVPWADWYAAQRQRLAGRRCYGGLDLASTIDLTAFVLLFPEDDGGYTLLPRFWVPTETVRKRVRADGVRYDTWVRLGLLTATDGDWCDYNVVQADIKREIGLYDCVGVNFDPKECSMLAQKLIADGVAMTPFPQSFTRYNEPVKLFEQLVNEGKIFHGGNPVLQWMAASVALERNIAGLRLPSKGKSGEKIDGIVAAVMAIELAMLHPPSPTPTVSWI
jgi:phage terminase large subunit-like protein